MVVRVPDDELGPPPPVTVAVQAGRFRYPPEGMFGGGPGSKAGFLRNRQPADPSGLTFCNPGDVIEFHSAGGGGYGNPFERDAEAVESDVVNGYVSIERAREDYGVILEPDTMKVDLAATLGLRKEKRVVGND
jgi:N-methylhydantoinase B